MKGLVLLTVLGLAIGGPIAVARAIDSSSVAEHAADRFAAEVCGPETGCVSSSVDYCQEATPGDYVCGLLYLGSDARCTAQVIVYGPDDSPLFENVPNSTECVEASGGRHDGGGNTKKRSRAPHLAARKAQLEALQLLKRRVGSGGEVLTGGSCSRRSRTNFICSLDVRSPAGAICRPRVSVALRRAGRILVKLEGGLRCAPVNTRVGGGRFEVVGHILGYWAKGKPTTAFAQEATDQLGLKFLRETESSGITSSYAPGCHQPGKRLIECSLVLGGNEEECTLPVHWKLRAHVWRAMYFKSELRCVGGS